MGLLAVARCSRYVLRFVVFACPQHPSSIINRFLRILENRLVLLHKTEVPDVPLAMKEFQGRLLVGVGKSLRVSNTLGAIDVIASRISCILAETP